jgi:putative transposase
LHHIAVNGNNRQALFLDDSDRLVWIMLLRTTAKRYGWDVKSYCQMDTHWHAVVRTPEANIALGMQRLNSAYSYSLNRRTGRSGHSIRHSYMSVLIEDDGHLRELTRYLPLNPVRGGLVTHPEDWEWSSYRAELGLEDRPRWMDTAWALRIHGTVAAHRAYVNAGMAEPGVHWTPGSDPTTTPPRRPGGCTAPRPRASE